MLVARLALMAALIGALSFESCVTTKGLSSCSFSEVMNSGPEGKPLATCLDTHCYKACGGT